MKTTLTPPKAVHDGDILSRGIILNNGLNMPAVAIGTRRKDTPGIVYQAVFHALTHGYRHIDTAWSYGCEGEVGQAIRDSNVPREEIWVTTKLDNQWHDRVPEALQLSLQGLKTDYVDTFLMHWPCPVDPTDPSKVMAGWHFTRTWAEMQKLPRELVRSIGVANFGTHNLHQLLQCDTTRVTPVVNQIELHPYRPSTRLIKHCAELGIQCVAFSPLGSLGQPFKEDTVIQGIADTRRRTPQQIILRWHLQRRCAVIPSSFDKTHIEDNFALAGWELSNDEMQALSSIPTRLHVYNDRERTRLPARVFYEEDEDEN